MTEKEVAQELDHDPFRPLRIHLVSGKTVDILRPDAAWTLEGRLLVFRNFGTRGTSAETYDIIGYPNIERIEVLDIGARSAPTKRKRA